MGWLEEKLKSYQDFPKEGIIFRDVFSWFRDPDCLRELSKKFSEAVKAKGWDKVDIVVGLESRGFLFGPILALEFGAGFVPVRKPGKLPGELESVSYVLEYRSDTFEIQKDSILPGQKVLIVDDLLATGGSLKASCELVQRLQGEVVGSVVAIELEDLKGRDKIPIEVHCLFKF